MKDAFTRARRWAITRWQTVIRVIPAEESRAAWKAYLDTWKAGRSSDRQGWIRRWVVNSRLRRAGHALDLPQEEGVKKMRHWFYIKGRLKRRQRTPRCRSNDPDQHTPMQFHRRCIVADAFTSRPRATRVFFFPGRGERGETPFDIFASAFGGKCWREREREHRERLSGRVMRDNRAAELFAPVDHAFRRSFWERRMCLNFARSPKLFLRSQSAVLRGHFAAFPAYECAAYFCVAGFSITRGWYITRVQVFLPLHPSSNASPLLPFDERYFREE